MTHKSEDHGDWEILKESYLLAKKEKNNAGGGKNKMKLDPAFKKVLMT